MEQTSATNDGPARLREFIRATPGMSQEKLARQLGIHQSQVSKFCLDKRRPRSKALRARIAEIAKVPVEAWDRPKRKRAPRQRVVLDEAAAAPADAEA